MSEKPMPPTPPENRTARDPSFAIDVVLLLVALLVSLLLASPLTAAQELAGIEPATVSTGESFADESVSTRNLLPSPTRAEGSVAQDQAPAAQEPPAEPAGAEDPTLADYIAPSAWCPLRSGDEPAAFGCDGGLAVSLVDRSWRDYSAVGVVFVGAETVGLGVAWCRSRLCVGAGVAAARDDFGIDTDSVAPVVGATFSLGGIRGE